MKKNIQQNTRKLNPATCKNVGHMIKWDITKDSQDGLTYKNQLMR